VSFLELKNVCKAYGEGKSRSQILSDINLSVDEFEFVAIVGFSGSGKSTLISTIAGLTQPDTGTVSLNGKEIKGPGPDRGVVFQSYSLMPWLTVQGNIALAVDQVFTSEKTEEREARVQKYIDMVGLSHAADRYPACVSG
jgi:nitrate/nitrite transport system ATP-binding protein